MIVLFCFCTSSLTQQVEAQLLRTGILHPPAGRMVGEILEQSTDLHVYRGIPFAKPPVRELRWRPPQPLGAWEGVRDCLENGSQSGQPWKGPAYGNEACLE